VSDHGFLPTETELHLNSAFQRAGLIELDGEGKVRSWRAYAWMSGGSAAVMLRDPKDNDARNKCQQILKRLAKDPNSGLAQVLDRGRRSSLA
jgi:hypothetical protein